MSDITGFPPADEHEAAFGTIIEGRCPNDDEPLDRADGFGWCHRCGRGWQARTATQDDPDGFPPGEHLVTVLLPIPGHPAAT